MTANAVGSLGSPVLLNLAKTFFRVSTTGELPLPILKRFLGALETSIAEIRASR